VGQKLHHPSTLVEDHQPRGLVAFTNAALAAALVVTADTTVAKKAVAPTVQIAAAEEAQNARRDRSHL